MPRREPPPEPSTTSLLPMQLHVGDRFTDATGEWEIAARPWGSVGGKLVHARVRKVGDSAVTEEKTWSAFERIQVRRPIG
jgi:hypothetical protein